MSLEIFQLIGKNTLVTGSRRGLGAAIAVLLTEAGANAGCHGIHGDGQHHGLAIGPVLSRQLLERIPAGGWGEGKDIAGAALYLCSSASDYVHGHALAVYGGWLAR